MISLVKNGLLLITTVVLSLIISEIVVRQFFHPVDYLLPTTTKDPFLGHRILPDTGGHDDRGFRNYSVPSNSEIVAIGDSHTYGISATFQESWPAHLSRLTDTQVYSLALGGYGPLQYLHLLSTSALELKPETVVVGLFLGNDLADSYRLAYSHQYWADYRNPLLQNEQSEQTEVTVNWKEKRFLNGARKWLAKSSVLYRIVTQSVVGELVQTTEFKNASPKVINLQHGELQHHFMPDRQSEALDTNFQNIREGIRISKAAIKKINLVCQTNQIKLLVALIPTKELVYSELFQEQYKSNLPESLAQQFENENTIRAGFKRVFEKENIAYVDILPALRRAVSQGKNIYPINDGHTNGKGYQIIAKEINSVL